MEFQTLKGSKYKKVAIGVILFITIISIILIGRSYASYRKTDSLARSFFAYKPSWI